MPFFPNPKKFIASYSYDYENFVTQNAKSRSLKSTPALLEKSTIILPRKTLKTHSPLPVRFTVNENPFTFDFCFVHKPGSPKLYLIFSGSKKVSQQAPVFQRHSWHSDFDGSVLFISDPLFLAFPNLALAWYLGTTDIDLYPIMADMVHDIIENYGFTEITTYGSSGGGFAALKICEFLSQSACKLRAIAINPQIFIKNYNYYSSFRSITKFSDKDESVKSRLRINIKKDVVYLILQNETDARHCKAHLFPLMKEQGIFPKYGLTGYNNFYAWLYHAYGGHNSHENIHLLKFILFLAEQLPVYATDKLDELDNLACGISEFWGDYALIRSKQAMQK